ncbi:uncharacterized protein LY89DRAFT_687220 [Mollisia scopiformis]|uniref:Uncharacterized protein n=1 Tax=Mollisia scopiformis TaxID=149040 RepID=A0A194X1M5_MOLSC|nr:uncharacterized protein LY89DRAFT_687220 [Mollisia scopiformis]KUJ13884.1 hypothetical protein LY89DRAFT_687220 [Mollisia scopiformis]
MMFFKSAFALSALLVVASAMSIQRLPVPAHEEMSILLATDAVASPFRAASFSATASSCEKEDEDDCKEFCGLSEQTATCKANGNKITCFCKGGKSESKCEERCLLCMPDKSALEEASRLFKLGGSRVDEL